MSSNAGFDYYEDGRSKLKTSYDVSMLQRVFSNIRNHIEKNIKEVIINKYYGAGMNDMIIIIHCHSKGMLEDIKKNMSEQGYNNNFGEEFKHRGKLGESSVRIDSEEFVNADFTKRVDMMFDAVKRSVKEFKKIMDSRKIKKEFDIEEFFKDLDIAQENSLKILEEVKGK